MNNKYELLAFNIDVLSWLNLWSTKDDALITRKLKDYSLLLPVLPAYLLVFLDMVDQMTGNFEDISDITENLIATVACVGGGYILTCFSMNRERIRSLIEQMHVFRGLSDERAVLETERKVSLFSKTFLAYGVLGSLFYTSLPLFQTDACKLKRLHSRHSQRVPCGMVVRCIVPEGWEGFPYVHLIYLNQVYTCTILSFVTLSVTVLLCGLIMHIVTQIRFLKDMLLAACDAGKGAREVERGVHYCAKYHQMIIDYAVNLNDAFSTMMLMHLTLTSLCISILGFEIIMVNSISDSIRFGLHLGGWIILLLLTCYYGQKLIDESTGIGAVAYSAGWYFTRPSIQKDISLIILRSQRPLTLTADSLGVMSLEIFLMVMKSAYSYFTLLLKVKN